MDGPGDKGRGVFASMGRLLKTVLSMAQNRVELLLVEAQEERWRVLDVLLLAGVVLIFALMTLLSATITIVALCLKAGRLDLIVVLVAIYLVATVVCFWRLQTRLKKWVPFSATLAELKKDKACLDETN